MASMPGYRLSDAEIILLAACEQGHTFGPSDAGEEDFEAVVERLKRLRDRGLLRLDEGRFMKSARGTHLRAGPCDLTDAGRVALEQDRRLGPRSSSPNGPRD